MAYGGEGFVTYVTPKPLPGQFCFLLSTLKIKLIPNAWVASGY